MGPITLNYCDSDFHIKSIDDDWNHVATYEYDTTNKIWGGIRGTHGVRRGKVFFEAVIRQLLKHPKGSPVGIRSLFCVGWSTMSAGLALGEEAMSYGYCSTGKKWNKATYTDFGEPYTKDEVILCYIDLEASPPCVGFMRHGINQGPAFTLPSPVPEKGFFPHLMLRHIEVSVNFGNRPYTYPPPDSSYKFLGDAPEDWLVKGPFLDVPDQKDCTVIVMVGLPGSGKTTWAKKLAKKEPEKNYKIISVDSILEMMSIEGESALEGKSMEKQQQVVKCATESFNCVFGVPWGPHNVILDGDNIKGGLRARILRRLMESQFKVRIAVVVPDDVEYKRRKAEMNKTTMKGPVTKEKLLRQMAFFSLPEESYYCDDLEFMELGALDASDLVKKYNLEAIAAGYNSGGLVGCSPRALNEHEKCLRREGKLTFPSAEDQKKFEQEEERLLDADEDFLSKKISGTLEPPLPWAPREPKRQRGGKKHKPEAIRNRRRDRYGSRRRVETPEDTYRKRKEEKRQEFLSCRSSRMGGGLLSDGEAALLSNPNTLTSRRSTAAYGSALLSDMDAQLLQDIARKGYREKPAETDLGRGRNSGDGFGYGGRSAGDLEYDGNFTGGSGSGHRGQRDTGVTDVKRGGYDGSGAKYAKATKFDGSSDLSSKRMVRGSGTYRTQSSCTADSFLAQWNEQTGADINKSTSELSGKRAIGGSGSYHTPDSTADSFMVNWDKTGDMNFTTSGNSDNRRGNPTRNFNAKSNATGNFGTSNYPTGNYGTSGNPTGNFGTSNYPSGNYGTSGNPTGNFGTTGYPSGNYGTSGNTLTENFGTSGNPTGSYGTIVNLNRNFGTSGNPARKFGTSGNRTGNFRTSGNPAENFGTSGNSTGNFGTSGYSTGNNGNLTRSFGANSSPTGNFGQSGNPTGNFGQSGNATGNFGQSGNPARNFGTSGNRVGNFSQSSNATGNFGQSGNTTGNFDQSSNATGNFGQRGNATGNFGQSGHLTGNFGQSGNPTGNFGQSGNATVNFSQSGNATGNFGQSGNATGYFGQSGNATGYFGQSGNATGNFGTSGNPTGNFGTSGNPTGNFGTSGNATGNFGNVGNPTGNRSNWGFATGNVGTNVAGNSSTGDNPFKIPSTSGTYSGFNTRGNVSGDNVAKRSPDGNNAASSKTSSGATMCQFYARVSGNLEASGYDSSNSADRNAGWSASGGFGTEMNSSSMQGSGFNMAGVGQTKGAISPEGIYSGQKLPYGRANQTTHQAGYPQNYYMQ